MQQGLKSTTHKGISPLQLPFNLDSCSLFFAMALAVDAVIDQVVGDDIEGEENDIQIAREEIVKSKTTRKRPCDPTQWARSVRKLKRAKGEEYVNTRQRVVAEIGIGRPCTCRRKCFEKIGEEQIKLIFEGFVKLSSKDKQDSYLFSLISCSPVQRQRPRTNEKERSHSFYYRVKTPDCDVVVCKQAFMSIHGITPKRLRRLCEHSLVSSTPPIDKRGKHENHCHTDERVVKQIRDHIESFPAQESHYSRSDNHGKTYLSENLNIRRMYHLYLERFEPQQLERIQQGLPFTGIVKEHLYR